MMFSFDGGAKTVEQFADQLPKTGMNVVIFVSRKRLNPIEFYDFVNDPKNSEEVARMNKQGIITSDMTLEELNAYQETREEYKRTNPNVVTSRRGGRREGAGRKPSEVKKATWSVKVTEEEKQLLKKYLEEVRESK